MGGERSGGGCIVGAVMTGPGLCIDDLQKFKKI